MQTLDLVRHERRSKDYYFKHALVRDALYQSLLAETRTALHLRIAEEIERRSGNRLSEVAEVLAHHYRQTDRASQSAYLFMAGSRSLGSPATTCLPVISSPLIRALIFLERPCFILYAFLLMTFTSSWRICL